MTRSTPHDSDTTLGAVAIGRNEGDRLIRCLTSVQRALDTVVYVDSGSSDDSVARARELGAHVVQLDPALPFTAARARNEGFDRLRQERPDLTYVQFVDGDCELAEGWIDDARAELERHPDIGIVAGRRRERFPDASPYNRLADMEWDTPIGDAEEVGGDALIRVRAFLDAGQYDPTLIAGEDPELCLRIRRAGWRVVRIDQEMTVHDAAMHSARQWWARATRAGHAYAESFHMHGASKGNFRSKEVRSIVFWGGVVPTAAVLGAPVSAGLSVAGAAAAYSVLMARIYRHRRARGDSRSDARLYALATSVGKLAEMRGMLRYARHLRKGSRSPLIEYKNG